MSKIMKKSSKEKAEIPQINVTQVAISSNSSSLALPTSPPSGGISADILAQLGESATVIKKPLKECPVDSVTVFSDRAEVVREISFTVEKSGLYDIVIEGITQSSDEKSVRVDALNQDDGKKHKKKKAKKSARGTKDEAEKETPKVDEDEDEDADDNNNQNELSSVSCTILEVSSELVDSDDKSNPEIQALDEKKKKIEKEIEALNRVSSVITKQQDWLQKYAKSVVASPTSTLGTVSSVPRRRIQEQRQEIYVNEQENNDDDSDADNNALSTERGGDKGVRAPSQLDWVDNFLNMFGERSTAFAEALFKNSEQKAAVQERLMTVNRELAEARTLSGAMGGGRSRRVVVGVFCSGAGKVALRCSYMTFNASWSSTYDCRVSSDSCIQLIYYGDIYNGSNEHWESCKISLSTAEATVGGEPPPLRTAIVEFGSPVHYAQSKSRKFGKANYGDNNENPMFMNNMSPEIQVQSFQPAQQQIYASVGGGGFGGGAVGTLAATFDEGMNVEVSQATVNDAPTSATFAIAGKKTIASDNKNHKVTILVQTLPTTFTHTAVVHCGKVFLRGTATNKSEGALLAGEMAVYIDGSFVCNVSLKTVLPNAQFHVFLGVDSNVTMKVMPEKGKGRDTGLFSKTRVDEKRRLIKLKNHRKDKISVTMFDQLPMSRDSAIKVKLIEPSQDVVEKKSSNVVLNEFNNLRWLIPMEPGADTEVVFHYEISFPSDKEIRITNN